MHTFAIAALAALSTLGTPMASAQSYPLEELRHKFVREVPTWRKVIHDAGLKAE